jgi:Polyketide cyclase / dehydrase and lipid transport
MADLQGTRSIQVAASPERCFDIAADLDRVPEWHEAMTDVEVLERDGDGRARLVESEIDATVARVWMRLRFEYDEPFGVRWTRESGVVVRTLRGPVRAKIEAVLPDRPVSGLKARAEESG